MMTALGFSLMKISVRDAQAAEAFYGASLGLKRTVCLELGEGNESFTELIMGLPDAGSGQTQIAFLQYHHKAPPVPSENVLVFTVADVERCLAAMVEAGGTCIVPPKEIAEHRVKLAFVKDPEHNIIEIMQYLP